MTVLSSESTHKPLIPYALYVNGTNLISLRALGGIQVLEDRLGPPQYVVASGTGALIASQYAYLGLHEASEKLKKAFEAMKKLFQGSLVGVKLVDTKITRKFRFFSQLSALVKTTSSSRSLGIFDASKLDQLLEDQFSFIGTTSPKIPIYLSSFDIFKAQESIKPLERLIDLRKTLSIMPFYEPVFEGDGVFISTVSFQGIPSRWEMSEQVKYHICLDCVSEGTKFPSHTALEMMVFSDWIRTLELKKELKPAFDLVVKLWDWDKRFGRDAKSLVQYGTKTTQESLHACMKEWGE